MASRSPATDFMRRATLRSTSPRWRASSRVVGHLCEGAGIPNTGRLRGKGAVVVVRPLGVTIGHRTWTLHAPMRSVPTFAGGSCLRCRGSAWPSGRARIPPPGCPCGDPGPAPAPYRRITPRAAGRGRRPRLAPGRPPSRRLPVPPRVWRGPRCPSRRHRRESAR